MNFTDEKIKILNDLLSQYAFSTGFTCYYAKKEVSDTGVCSEYDISPSSNNLCSKRELSAGENLALFPIVFDYFDAVLDKKLSVNNVRFKKKKLMLSDLRNNGGLTELLEYETFGYALDLRNKIIHNDLTMSEEAGIILLPEGQKYKLTQLGLLNRLVFNVALKCAKNKSYSLYEKNAAFSIYSKLRDSTLPDTVKSLYQNGSLVGMVTCDRMYSDFSKKTISPSEPLFEILSEDIAYGLEGNAEDKFKKGIYGNYTFNFRTQGVDLIIPAELIIQNKSLTLQDVCDWKA